MTNQPTKSRLARPFGAVQEMGQLFDQLFYGNAGKANGGRTAPAWFAPACLWEDDAHFYVEIELPGVKSEDVEALIEKDTLRVTAERKAPEGERNYWHQERGFGRVERVVGLPETVDADSIEATLKDGVLSIKLSKKPELQPRRLQIN